MRINEMTSGFIHVNADWEVYATYPLSGTTDLRRFIITQRSGPIRGQLSIM